MALTTLAYVSEARQGLTLKDLKQILRRAREKNHRAGVSGWLVFDGAYFAQILEGEEGVLEPLLGCIEADPRHRDLRLLLHAGIDRRNFGATCMGCANLAAPVHIDTSELRGLLRDAMGTQQLPLEDAVELFRVFETFRTPEQASLLAL